MAFIIKNVSNHVIIVDRVPIDPGEQLTFNTLSTAVNNALDRGDLTLTLEDPGEHIDLKPFEGV